MITGKEVQQLRVITGAGVMDCKKVLVECKGDFKKAERLLKKKGVSKALKKAQRTANQGIIESYVHSGGRIGVMLELACETDFVAKNPVFRQLAHDLAMQIASMKPENETELLKQDFIKDADITVRELLENNITKIGENIKIKRFIRYKVGE